MLMTGTVFPTSKGGSFQAPEVWQHGGLGDRGLSPGLLRPAQSQKRVRTRLSAGIWLAPLTCDLMRAGQ